MVSNITVFACFYVYNLGYKLFLFLFFLESGSEEESNKQKNPGICILFDTYKAKTQVKNRPTY